MKNVGVTEVVRLCSILPIKEKVLVFRRNFTLLPLILVVLFVFGLFVHLVKVKPVVNVKVTMTALALNVV